MNDEVKKAITEDIPESLKHIKDRLELADIDGKEIIKNDYPLVYKAVESTRNGIVMLDRAIDHFYYTVSKLIKPTDTKPISIGQFVAEMAKAICYIFEESITESDEYYVLTFSDLDLINVASNCSVRIIERSYLVYNSAKQFVTFLPNRDYIYRHEDSLRYMLNFIDNLRNEFKFCPIKPMEIKDPIRMNIKPVNPDDIDSIQQMLDKCEGDGYL